MEWIKDISSTIFFPLTIGVCLVLIALLCAAYGQKKGYSYWGCMVACIAGTVPGMIIVLLLPNMTELREQQAASFRYRDKEIEELKAKCAIQEEQIARLEEYLHIC